MPYARTGKLKGLVWSIQTKKNNKITAVVANRKEEFTSWSKAEVWVENTIKSINKL